MYIITHDITEEEYEKAKEKGICSILPVWVVCGYGVYGGEVWRDDNGQPKITYHRGETCD